MMKKTIAIVGLIMLAIQAQAQEQLSLKQQADRYFDRYEYFKSLNLYLKIAGKNNAAITERIADCYREMNDYKNAAQWYAQAILQPKASKTDHYYYAEALLRDGRFNEAKAQYKLFYADGDSALELKLANCDSAAAWMKKPANCVIKNATNFNTQYSDWGLNFDGKAGFIFTSDRYVDADNLDNRTGNNWFKLYHANINGNDVRALPVSNQSNITVSGAYHIGPMAVNAAGDSAYITLTTEVEAKNLPVELAGKNPKQRLYTRRLQLLMAKKADACWAVYAGFPYNNVEQYSIGSAALSKDGRVIYFSSDMPGGAGKTDIWYCEKQPDGSWGKPVNCGKTINTKEEEAFPYMDSNGSLYFASKGLPGMGGYDIYKAEGAKDEWSTPQNLKFPINTTADDFYLVTRNGASGYLSSNRDGGNGSDDIYAFTGGVPDTSSHKKSRDNNAPQPPVTKAGRIILSNIYFDLDKANIRRDAAARLDTLAVLLKAQPSVKIEMAGYTDSRATADYNVTLSQHRAEAARDYLIAKGISADRMCIKWFGKENLVNQCADGVNCTEAEHQLNRRVEVAEVKN